MPLNKVDNRPYESLPILEGEIIGFRTTSPASKKWTMKNFKNSIEAITFIKIILKNFSFNHENCP